MSPRTEDFLDQAEAIRVALLRMELDLALSYLRVAVAESAMGDDRHALDYMERAIRAHKNVTGHLKMIPPQAEEKKTELEISARDLLDSIVTTERQFQILGISRRPASQVRFSPLIPKDTARPVKAKLRLC